MSLDEFWYKASFYPGLTNAYYTIPENVSETTGVGNIYAIIA